MNEEQYKLPTPDTNTLSHDSILLLGKLKYEVQAVEKTGTETHVKLTKPFKIDERYPRFHIILKIPLNSRKIEIASLHIDQKEDKSPINFMLNNIEEKNNEIKRLIDNLTMESKSDTRDQLLRELKAELLFGNSEEINHSLGPNLENRLKGLIRSMKGKELKKERRFRHDTNKQKMVIADANKAIAEDY